MPDYISKVTPPGSNTTYDIKDTTSRDALVDVIDGGAKSILPNNAVSGTLNQVAFTVNTDKSVKANGTASTAAWFELSSGNTLKKGTYVISGGETSVRVVLSTALTATAIIAQSQGSPTVFTLDSDTTGLYYSVRMSTGASAENVTVYPMICKKSLWDISQSYEPYAPTNRELYESQNNSFTFATCATAAAERVKAVTISDPTWTRTIGGMIAVKFSNTNTFSATAESKITLSINGGAEEEIYYSNTASPTGTNTNCYGYANRYAYYRWDGTYWVWSGHGTDNNSTYTPQSLGFGYGTCSTAAATVAKTATLSGYSLVTNGMPVIKFTNSVPANATLNINSKGAKAIYYRGSPITAGIINAGDTVTFVYSTYYHVTSII